MRPIDVLLIEDSAGDTLLIRQAIAGSGLAVQVHVARDGEQARALLDDAELRPALIILDLHIPRIPGHLLLERHKSAATPIVVFTSSPNPDDRERCLALGAREYVQKPMDVEEFQDAVRGMLLRWLSPGAAAGSG